MCLSPRGSGPQRPCAVAGCTSHTRKYGDLCGHHRRNLAAYGHVLARPPQRATYILFIAAAETFLHHHRDHPTVRAWEDVVEGAISRGAAFRAQFPPGRKMTAADTAMAFWGVLEGLGPRKTLSIILAVLARRHAHPQAFQDAMHVYGTIVRLLVKELPPHIGGARGGRGGAGQGAWYLDRSRMLGVNARRIWLESAADLLRAARSAAPHVARIAEPPHPVAFIEPEHGGPDDLP